MSDDATPLTFDQVLAEELAAIKRRRALVFREIVDVEPEPAADDAATAGHIQGDGGEYQRLKKVRKDALRSHLVGLTFSGGGIRSATFAVGILQGLATLGLLKRIDYLSTVSGGGWAGGWLAAWLKREGSLRNVEKQLARSRVSHAQAERHFLERKVVVDEEPEPIHHLRAYSRFLAPRSGYLTADMWSLVTTYLRNVTINLSMLLPAALALVFAVRIVVAACHLLGGDPRNGEMQVLVRDFLAAGAIAFVCGLYLNARAVNYIPRFRKAATIRRRSTLRGSSRGSSFRW